MRTEQYYYQNINVMQGKYAFYRRHLHSKINALQVARGGAGGYTGQAEISSVVALQSIHVGRG